MNIKKIGLGLIALFILGAAGCRGGGSDTVQLGRLVITTQINQDNTPVAEVATVVDNAPKIYLTAEIINGRKGDRVQVTWRRIAKDQTIATENFTGRRSSERPSEFVAGTTPATSWLASTLTLTDISWSIGDYEAVVQLNDNEGQRVGFTIVTEREYDAAIKQSWVKSVRLGTEINSQYQITVPATQFERTTDKIYAVALLQNVPARTKFQGAWKLLETNLTLSNFITEFSGNGYLPFELSLDQAGRSVWTKGNYTFTLYVDNLPVATNNFTIS